MVHGGIRYLQQREFRLVYENLAERQRLLDNAPAPRQPFCRSSSRSSGATAWSRRRSPAPTPRRCGCTTSPGAGASGTATRRSTRRARSPTSPPSITAHLVAGFLYYDARADDARLTLTIARTAAHEYGAAVANYTPVVRLTTGPDGKISGAVVRPRPRRRRRPISRYEPESWSMRPGVWADALRTLDEGTHPALHSPGQGRARDRAGRAHAV